MLGRVIAGKFEIESILGSGAMGVVFKARHVSLEVPVALKVLHAELAADERFSKRFRLEAKIACSVAHASSVRTIDCGAEADGTLYLAMEYVDGRDLFALLAQRGRLSARRSAHLMSQVLSALAAAHAVGIVHRDVKPENILVVLGEDDDGNPSEIAKVCDFGIASIVSAVNDGRGAGGARLTQGMVVGTPAYMSPEQARGQSVDGRTDLYAVGVVLYQLLTGSLPFDASEPLAVVLKHLNDPPPAPESVFPGVHSALAQVALTALAKDPASRFDSARAMRGAVRKAMGWTDHDAHSRRMATAAPGALDSPVVSGRGQPTPTDVLRTLTGPLAVTGQEPSVPTPSAPRVSPTPGFQLPPPAPTWTGSQPAPTSHRGLNRLFVVASLTTLFLAGWVVMQRSTRGVVARWLAPVGTGSSAAQISADPRDVGAATFARPTEVAEEAPTASSQPPSATRVALPIVGPAANPRAREPDAVGTGERALDAFVAGHTGSSRLPPEPAAAASAESPAVTLPPSAAPRPPGSAWVTIGGVSGERGVTPRSVTGAITGIMPRFVECYRSASPSSPGTGVGTLHLDTDGDGVVTSASAHQPAAPATARCIERVALGMQLAGVDTGEATADVSLSFHHE